MNILVINVSLRPDSPVKMFPVGLGYIVTAIRRAGYFYDLIDVDAHRYRDAQVEMLLRRRKYDVVCLGCIVTGYRIVKKLASTVRTYHPQAKIVVGNTVAASIPDILLRNTEADVAVLGEGDITIVELLEAIGKEEPLDSVEGIAFKYQDGKIVKTVSRAPIQNLDDHFWIDFSLFDTEIYIENAKYTVSEPLPMSRDEVRLLPVNTARGCVANCTFCYHAFKGRKYRPRSAKSILDEIEHLQEAYQVNYAMFYDELTFYNRAQTRQFAEEIEQRGMNVFWAANCRAGLFRREEDLEIISKLKESGCLRLGFSLESADDAILAMMDKKTSVEQFREQVKLCRKAGLAVVTSLVLGFPMETPETIETTFDVCIESGIYPSVGYLLPQPGSVMYDYARNHGYVDNEEDYLLSMGDRQDLLINMTQMSNEQFVACVEDGARKANKSLSVGLSENSLIKTTYYRSAKT